MDVGNIAELNTFLVLDAIRSHGEATRRQLSRELGLSDASVSRIVKRLLDGGLIEELPRDGASTAAASTPATGTAAASTPAASTPAASTAAAGTPAARIAAAGTAAASTAAVGSARGRTPSVLRFVGPPGAVIAVDLGGTRCHGALADLAGATLAMDFRASAGADDAAATLLACIRALQGQAAGLSIPVRAVVVGIPALIDPVSQLATAGPNVHWQGFDLLSVLDAELTEPFEVDNDVNLAALGEAWRGQGRGISSFVTMSLGTGIGGAVVIDGHLVRGSHNAAGEVAYFPFWPRPPAPAGPAPAGPVPAGPVPAGPVPAGPVPGRPGFEDVASGPALRARAAELIRAGVSSALALQPGGQPGFEVADVFAAATAGDPAGRQVVGELTGYVAAAIAGVTALVDPERIILDGAIGRALEPWLPGLRAAVAASVFRPPGIVVSGLGADAAIAGAIARALAIVSELDVPAHLRPIARERRKS
ncbi:MAG TPA: ROK family transcriptional regulator [Streptosporangiaceae bacterium]|nr:ROK family transcriptional regulator [Streptosporangiaceae bacterium]